MNWKAWFTFFSGFLILSPFPALYAQSPAPQGSAQRRSVAVPEAVAQVLRPLLDELQNYRSKNSNDEHQLDEQFRVLIGKKDRSADEALAVLLCFNMGE